MTMTLLRWCRSGFATRQIGQEGLEVATKKMHEMKQNKFVFDYLTNMFVIIVDQSAPCNNT